MESLTNLVSNVGFPIAITVFMLIKMDNSFKELSESVKSLTKEIKNNKKCNYSI